MMEGQAKMEDHDYKNLIRMNNLETPPIGFHKETGNWKSREHLKHKGPVAAGLLIL